MKITNEKYQEIKAKTEDLTINELVKKFKISPSTARKIRATKNYPAYLKLGRTYRENRELQQEYEKMVAETDLQKANFNVALVGIVIIIVAVLIGLFL